MRELQVRENLGSTIPLTLNYDAQSPPVEAAAFEDPHLARIWQVVRPSLVMQHARLEPRDDDGPV